MDINIESILNDIKTDIADVFYGVIDTVLSVTASVIESIPAPEFLEPLAGYVANIPPQSLYFLEPFQLPFAFSVISASVTSRMLLSIIPFIGGAFR